MILSTTIRQNPPDHRGGYDLDSTTLTSEAEAEAGADAYDQA